jgi:hypothetical protein
LQACEKVIVVDPNKFDVKKKSVKKTDRNDSRTLMLFLSKEMVPEGKLMEDRIWIMLLIGPKTAEKLFLPSWQQNTPLSPG